MHDPDPMTAGQRLAANALWTAALLFAVLAAGGLAGIDVALARYTAGLPRDGTLWSQGTALLDTIALKGVSNFLLGAILIIAAILLSVLRATRPAGLALLYVGAVQFVATCFADFAKPPFGRLRPHESLTDIWFAAGNSFPSGHAAFYAGLFLPLMVLFPRYSALFAIPPLFVGVSRLMEHDHYLSDVAVSFGFAALLAAGLSFLVERSRAL